MDTKTPADLVKLEQNEKEDKAFSEQLEKYYNNELRPFDILQVCSTPYSLKLSGANSDLNIVINQSTIRKCISPVTAKTTHGHSLSRDIMEQLPKELRNPIMVFTNKEKNALVVITDLVDSNNQQVMVAVGLNRESNRSIVNRITSAYGRSNFLNYIQKQTEKGNLVAVNKEKADKIFQDAGLRLPSVENLISFNDSISYTLQNVNYPNVTTRRSIMPEVKDTSVTITDEIIGNLNEPNNIDVGMELNPQFTSEVTNADFDKINKDAELVESTEIEQNEYDKANAKVDETELQADNKQTDEVEQTKVIEENPTRAIRYTDIEQINFDLIQEVKNGNIKIDMPATIIDNDKEIDIMEALHTVAESDSHAQNILGVCYTLGINTEVDEQKAMEYFNSASEQGNPIAMRNLAIALENTSTPDYNRINELYTQSANAGDSYAQNNLGVCYLLGEGVKKDVRKAVQWFEKSANAGDDFAMVNLADCYSIGNGVRKNEKKAFDLYMLAAEKGNVLGIKAVADSLYNGTGVKQDFSEAIKFYKLASDKGDVESQRMYETLQQKLSPQRHEFGKNADVVSATTNVKTENKEKSAELAKEEREAPTKKKTEHDGR